MTLLCGVSCFPPNAFRFTIHHIVGATESQFPTRSSSLNQVAPVCNKQLTLLCFAVLLNAGIVTQCSSNFALKNCMKRIFSYEVNPCSRDQEMFHVSWEMTTWYHIQQIPPLWANKNHRNQIQVVSCLRALSDPFHSRYKLPFQFSDNRIS